MSKQLQLFLLSLSEQLVLLKDLYWEKKISFCWAPFHSHKQCIMEYELPLHRNIKWSNLAAKHYFQTTQTLKMF